MVHVRLNQRETNPNPHINFISALPALDASAQEDARQLLRALAAQVRPVMKAHGFVVNSLEEYEHNSVFAGRNWNNGEVIELVLRGASGAYLPISWLMGTLCHELAHIKHMNHGPAFQALWTQLRNEVRDLQRKGYYGDGYWSSGKRLADSATVASQGLDAGDIPEYMCGGAQTRTRPTALRRRRNRQQAGPSNHTGAQTAKRRKAGSRVTAQNVFKGEGKALNADVEDEDQKKVGSGFRKKAGSKRAREERALAAERRLLALQSPAGSSGSSVKQEQSDGDDDDEEDTHVPETDQQRRQTLLDSVDDPDLDSMKLTRMDFSDDFAFPSVSNATASSSSSKKKPDQGDLIEISSDDEDPLALSACDVQNVPVKGFTATTSATKSPPRTARSKRGAHHTSSEQPELELEDWPKKPKVSYGGIVQDEVTLRKKESLGMTGAGRRLGGECPAPPDKIRTQDRGDQRDDHEWSCNVCTLSNAPGHLACSACGTPKGESIWADPAS